MGRITIKVTRKVTIRTRVTTRVTTRAAAYRPVASVSRAELTQAVLRGVYDLPAGEDDLSVERVRHVATQNALRYLPEGADADDVREELDDQYPR